MNWHGWKVVGEDKAIHIGLLPGRKQFAIYTVTGSVLHPLAYFRSEEDAVEAVAIIDHLTGLRVAGVSE